MHMMADRSTAKLKRHLSHPITTEYGFSCLCESMSARRLYIEGGSFFAHAASGGEDKRGEHAVLYILDSLVVFSFLGGFMLFTNGRYVFGAIARSIGVEHPHIEVGILC